MSSNTNSNDKTTICTNCFHSKEKHHFYASQKDNDHHCKEFGCKCIQYFEQ